MKFKVNYTFEDYLESQKLYLKGLKSTWVIKLLGFLLIFIFLLSWSIGQFAYLDLFFVLFALALIFSGNLLPYVWSKILFKKAKNLHRETAFEVTEKGITSENEVEYGKSEWEAYVKYLYNEKVVVLFKSANVVTVLPKREVGKENWPKLIDLAKENIKVSI